MRKQSDSGRRSEDYFSERVGNIDGDKRRRIRVLLLKKGKSMRYDKRDRIGFLTFLICKNAKVPLD